MRQNAWIDSSVKKTGNADKCTQSDGDFPYVPDKNFPVERVYGVKEGIAAAVGEQVSVSEQDEEESERNVTVYVRRLYIYNY